MGAAARLAISLHDGVPTARSARDVVRRARLVAATLRHLRPVQWFYLPIRRLQRGPPPVEGTHAAPIEDAGFARLREVVLKWRASADVEADDVASDVLAGRFCFLNRCLVLPEIEWTAQYASRLWTFNLHYFDYGVALARASYGSGDARYSERLIELADSWMRGTASRTGDGWHPYTVSQRVGNWVEILSLLHDRLPPDFTARLLSSLARQLRVLELRPELDIQANHLLKNYSALALGGLVFRDANGARWRRRGLRGLVAELERQVTADGMHVERSPMYHTIALADLVKLIAVYDAVGEPIPESVRSRAGAMWRVALRLRRLDGSHPLFADSANGISSSANEVDRLAGLVLGPAEEEHGAFALPAAGYFGYRSEDGREQLIVSAAAPSPRYQPAHSHCDALSFELEFDGRPVVVDSGVNGYDDDYYRDYCRSTRAHNTVSIAGREQSEMWSTFRVGRRANRVRARAGGTWEDFCFEGSYRPFSTPRATHSRRIDRTRGGVNVTDVVDGAREVPLYSYLHLHPDFRLVVKGTSAIARLAGMQVLVTTFGIDSITVRQGEDDPVQGWYCAEFGGAVPAPALQMGVDRYDGRPFGYHISWSRF